MQSGKRLKICYVITKGNWGGAQKYLFSLATHLPKNQFDVVAIVGAGGILKRKLEENGIKTYELSELKRDISILSEIKSSWEILRIIWREKPEVLHLNSPKASGLGAVAGRLCFTPKIIQTIHGWTFNENRSFISKGLIYFFSWITVLLCHKTIVIGKNEKKQALAMPLVNPEKIVLVRNGVGTVKYIERAIIQEALLARVGLSEFVSKRGLVKTAWIGTVAELHRNKGLEFSILALSKIKTPFVYFILGEGEERKKLEGIIRQHGLEHKVFLIGHVDNANLYLKAFDIFLLPSMKEGLPYTILEAGLASLPVISSSVGGVPDIIDDAKTGLLVRPGAVSEITRGVEYLVSHPEKRKEFGDNLRKKVEKEFSLGEMIKRTVKLYK